MKSFALIGLLLSNSIFASVDVGRDRLETRLLQRSLNKKSNITGLKSRRDTSSSKLFNLDFNKKLRQLGPGNRPCCGFGADIEFLIKPIKLNQHTEVSELNSHFYGNNIFKEKNGEVYTCKGGFVDTGHLRHNADWTVYFAYLIEELSKNGGTIKLKSEGGKRWLSLKKPVVPFTKEQIIRISQRLTYHTSVWHEISTWYVPAVVPIYSEKASSFAPEDNFSNLLGTYVGAKTLRESGHFSDVAVDSIKSTLTDLGALKVEQTKEAFFYVENKWWTRKDKSIKKHTFSYEKGKVTPWRIEEYSNTVCKNTDSRVKSLKVPESIILDGIKVKIDSLYDFNVIAKKGIPINKLLGRINGNVHQNDLKLLVKKIRKLIKEDFKERNLGDPINL